MLEFTFLNLVDPLIRRSSDQEQILSRWMNIFEIEIKKNISLTEFGLTLKEKLRPYINRKSQHGTNMAKKLKPNKS